jgi:nicotinamide riboside kinase
MNGDNVRVRRIVVTGAESTGKTTLARELAGRLRTEWVPEAARGYAEARGAPLTAADVEPIAHAHIAAEAAALERMAAGRDTMQGSAPVLVLDTDLVSTVLYARHYYGHCPPWIVAEARARLADLYLLADVDLPWEPDPVRDTPGVRDVLHSRFVDELTAAGALVRILRGSGASRLRHALLEVSEMR